MPELHDELTEVQGNVDDAFAAYWRDLKASHAMLQEMSKLGEANPEMLDNDEFGKLYAFHLGRLMAALLCSPIILAMAATVKVMRTIGIGKLIALLGISSGAFAWWAFGGSSPLSFAGSICVATGAIAYCFAEVARRVQR